MLTRIKNIINSNTGAIESIFNRFGVDSNQTSIYELEGTFYLLVNDVNVEAFQRALMDFYASLRDERNQRVLFPFQHIMTKSDFFDQVDVPENILIPFFSKENKAEQKDAKHTLASMNVNKADIRDRNMLTSIKNIINSNTIGIESILDRFGVDRAQISIYEVEDTFYLVVNDVNVEAFQQALMDFYASLRDEKNQRVAFPFQHVMTKTDFFAQIDVPESVLIPLFDNTVDAKKSATPESKHMIKDSTVNTSNLSFFAQKTPAQNQTSHFDRKAFIEKECTDYFTSIDNSATPLLSPLKSIVKDYFSDFRYENLTTKSVINTLEVMPVTPEIKDQQIALLKIEGHHDADDLENIYFSIATGEVVDPEEYEADDMQCLEITTETVFAALYKEASDLVFPHDRLLKQGPDARSFYLMLDPSLPENIPTDLIDFLWKRGNLKSNVASQAKEKALKAFEQYKSSISPDIKLAAPNKDLIKRTLAEKHALTIEVVQDGSFQITSNPTPSTNHASPIKKFTDESIKLLTQYLRTIPNGINPITNIVVNSKVNTKEEFFTLFKFEKQFPTRSFDYKCVDKTNVEAMIDALYDYHNEYKFLPRSFKPDYVAPQRFHNGSFIALETALTEYKNDKNFPVLTRVQYTKKYQQLEKLNTPRPREEDLLDSIAPENFNYVIHTGIKQKRLSIVRKKLTDQKHTTPVMQPPRR